MSDGRSSDVQWESNRWRGTEAGFMCKWGTALMVPESTITYKLHRINGIVCGRHTVLCQFGASFIRSVSVYEDAYLDFDTLKVGLLDMIYDVLHSFLNAACWRCKTIDIHKAVIMLLILWWTTTSCFIYLDFLSCSVHLTCSATGSVSFISET